VCIYDDVSTDNTRAIIESYRAALLQRRIHLHVTTGTDGGHSGAGKPKHRAIMACSGRIVCLLDGDDYMADNRIESQLQVQTN
jgi:glycosyltransferase involved in cell wall biosynthesis